jgi:membrane associated rhomboid family serine protease
MRAIEEPPKPAREVPACWQVRSKDYLPAGVLVGAMLFSWLARSPAGMASWGVSAAGLGQGRYGTIILHMFAHGSWLHLLMNSIALLETGGLVVARLGGFPAGWLRFMAAFGLAGLGSMIFFLLVHPQGSIPMIGASGAVFGLLGLLLGLRIVEELEPVRLRELPSASAAFIKDNLLFLLILLVAGLLAAAPGGVAWEAHLGGFLLGLSLGPWLLPPLARTPRNEPV